MRNACHWPWNVVLQLLEESVNSVLGAPSWGPQGEMGPTSQVRHVAAFRCREHLTYNHKMVGGKAVRVTDANIGKHLPIRTQDVVTA